MERLVNQIIVILRARDENSERKVVQTDLCQHDQLSQRHRQQLWSRVVKFEQLAATAALKVCPQVEQYLNRSIQEHRVIALIRAKGKDQRQTESTAMLIPMESCIKRHKGALPAHDPFDALPLPHGRCMLELI